MKSFWNKHKKKIYIGVAVVAILLIIIGGKKGDTVSTYTVERKDVVDSLVLNGEAEPVNGADMAFSESGTVNRVYKKSGDKVYAGEKIVELDNAALYADLADANAALDLARAQAKVSNAELDQDVNNTYAKLLSDDLIAYPEDIENENTPPVVSGKYTGNVEGQYLVSVEPGTGATRLKIVYRGLESGSTEIDFHSVIKLGTKGLYLKFEKIETSIGDDWVIKLPNVEGSSYISNLNAYQDALASRDAADSSNVSAEINAAKVKQAEARVSRILADLNSRTIRAPFTGIVSKMSIKVGEQVSAGTVVTGVIAESGFEVMVEVPEVDIINLVSGIPASITLDAYGDDVVFDGFLATIDPGQTEVDGVSVYRAKVLFNEDDARIRPGMTAAVTIEKSKVEGVLSAPTRFIESDESGSYVLIMIGDEETKTQVTTGLLGSDGSVEILSGVSEGDILVGHFAE